MASRRPLTNTMSSTGRARRSRGLHRKKRKTLRQRLQAMSYMQASLSFFAAGLLALAFCLWRAVSSRGGSGLVVALVGILAFILAIVGIGVTLYGHFVVKMEGKVKWGVGIAANGVLAAFLLLLYLSGLGG